MLVALEAAIEQLAARGVGAVRGKLPVAVAAPAVQVGQAVGMATDAQVVGQVVEQWRHGAQKIAQVGRHAVAAEGKHRPLLVVQ